MICMLEDDIFLFFYIKSYVLDIHLQCSDHADSA